MVQHPNSLTLLQMPAPQQHCQPHRPHMLTQDPTCPTNSTYLMSLVERDAAPRPCCNSPPQNNHACATILSLMLSCCTSNDLYYSPLPTHKKQAASTVSTSIQGVGLFVRVGVVGHLNCNQQLMHSPPQQHCQDHRPRPCLLTLLDLTTAHATSLAYG